MVSYKPLINFNQNDSYSFQRRILVNEKRCRKMNRRRKSRCLQPRWIRRSCSEWNSIDQKICLDNDPSAVLQPLYSYRHFLYTDHDRSVRCRITRGMSNYLYLYFICGDLKHRRQPTFKRIFLDYRRKTITPMSFYMSTEYHEISLDLHSVYPRGN